VGAAFAENAEDLAAVGETEECISG